jgi:hypothetical protein
LRSRKTAERIVSFSAVLLALVLPALAQGAGPLKPIPKAQSWMLADSLQSARGCAAILDGETVDVNLLETKDGQMVLVASHPDWKLTPGKIKFRFQVDAGPDQPMEADGLGNLLVMSVDAALQTALFSAKEVTWKVPGAEYRAEVGGLKTAFAALKACNIRKGLKH